MNAMIRAAACAVALCAWSTAAAYSSYYSPNCASCHGTTSTCAGCHVHGAKNSSNALNVTATLPKTTFTPGESFAVTVNGGYRSGWVRISVFDQAGTEIAKARVASLPATVTVTAPATAGTYSWKAAWYGNRFERSGGTFGAQWALDPANANHGWEKVNLPAFTVAAPQQPKVALSPTSLAFGTVQTGSTGTLTAQVQNTGTASLSVTSVALCAGTSAEFRFSQTAAFSVAAGASQALTVTYAPTDTTSDSGCIELATNDPAAPLARLNVSGAGSAAPQPKIAFSPTSLTFGTVQIGASGTLTAQVQNTGNASLSVSKIAPCAGTSAEFRFTPTAAFSVAAGASQALAVTYTPADATADSGCVELTTNDPAAPLARLNVSGTGATPQQPKIVLAPASLPFGNVQVGATSALATQVRNTGTASLSITRIARCAGTSGEFGFTPAAAFSVAAGASQTLTVTYTPADTTADTGCVELTTNDPVTPVARLSVSATGVPPPAPRIALSPASLAFGTVQIGGSGALTAQVQNTGTASLSVTKIAACAGTSAEYTFSPAAAFSVAAGGSQPLAVTYRPVDATADAGCLELTTSDPATPLARLDLSGTGTAAPPPTQVSARQNLGIYDQTFNGFQVLDCFGCHATQAPACTDPLAPCQQVSAQHHNLLDPANPHYDVGFTCGTCHPTVLNPATGQYEMRVTLDCALCHMSSPHHTSVAAAAADCRGCHGNLVSNLADPKTIPTYAPSNVTPATGCRVWADSTGTVCKAGGCAACHAANASATPPISGNASLHHGTGLGAPPNPSSQCGWCHAVTVTNGVPSAALDIRACEQCHPYSSLHNIQFNYDTTNGTPGYGHVGADQDCWGCHGWFAKYELAPAAAATVPTIALVTPNAWRRGAAGDVVMSGQSLTNSIAYPDGTTRTFAPSVVLVQVDRAGAEIGSPVVLTPARFDESELVVTVPETLGTGTWQLRVAKAYGTTQQTVSNRLDAYVAPAVGVGAATLACASGSPELVIDGHGFGPQPPIEAPVVGAYVGAERCAITSWTDTRIVAACASAEVGATVQVVGAFNLDAPVSGLVLGDGCATPAADPLAVITATLRGVVYATPGDTAVTVPFSSRDNVVRLDGSASADAAAYLWAVDGPRSVTSTSPALDVKLTARGTYTATLVVTSAVGIQSPSATFTVVVR
jgi:hypothetical protein